MITLGIKLNCDIALPVTIIVAISEHFDWYTNVCRIQIRIDEMHLYIYIYIYIYNANLYQIVINNISVISDKKLYIMCIFIVLLYRIRFRRVLRGKSIEKMNRIRVNVVCKNFLFNNRQYQRLNILV